MRTIAGQNQSDLNPSTELAILSRQYECVVTNLKVIVYQTDMEGHWTFLNPAWETITGYTVEESLGRNFFDFLHENDKAQTAEKFVPLIQQEKDTCEHVVRYIKKSGEICWLEVYAGPTFDENGQITGCTGSLTDVTTKRLLDEEVRRTQRLESVGLLAAGIAHDFNNLLTVILNNLSHTEACDVIQGHSEIQNCISDAINASVRAKDLTQQLLTFSKGGAPILACNNLVEIVKDAVALGISGTEFTSTFHSDGDIPDIEVDAGQISQAIHNIVLNSVEAMGDAGTIDVKIQFDKDRHVRPEAHADGELTISITDTGEGMNQETLDHLFDPYFSTKKRGSGLGLALVYSIVDRHLGRIHVQSEMGKGTTVRIMLPGAGATLSRVKEPKPQFSLAGGRLLILDDNQQILRAIALLLNGIGFEVETVTDGEQAIATYAEAKEQGTPFDAIISDLSIPNGLGGVEVVQSLTDLDPGVVAIASSGYSNDPVMAEPGKYGFKGVLQKPYTVEKLKSALQSALAAN